MKKAVIATAILSVAATVAFASDDPIATRKAVMKNVGASVGALAKMVKGEADYDPLAAQLAMRTINSSAAGFVHFFPAGSETGGETEASPKIWEDMGGFTAAAAKLEADSAAAIQPAGEGLDAMKTAFGTVTKNCGACHENFRIKKN